MESRLGSSVDADRSLRGGEVASVHGGEGRVVIEGGDLHRRHPRLGECQSSHALICHPGSNSPNVGSPWGVCG